MFKLSLPSILLFCAILAGAFMLVAPDRLAAQSETAAGSAATDGDNTAVTFNEINLEGYTWIDQAFQPGGGYSSFESRRNYIDSAEKQRIYEERQKQIRKNIDLIDAGWRNAMRGSALAAQNRATSGGQQNTALIPASEAPPKGLFIPKGAFTGSDEQETAYLPDITAGMGQAPYLSNNIGRGGQKTTEAPPAAGADLGLELPDESSDPDDDDPNAPHKTLPPVPSMF